MTLRAFFRPDPARYEGVRPVNVVLLRVFFLLVVVFVGYDAVGYLLRYEPPAGHVQAAAFSMWAAFAVMGVLGFLHPLRMLPLVAFDIVYKVIWLGVVAWPLWSTGRLAGSPAEEMTGAFLWVVLPAAAMPWRYAFHTLIRGRNARAPLARVAREALGSSDGEAQ